MFSIGRTRVSKAHTRRSIRAEGKYETLANKKREGQKKGKKKKKERKKEREKEIIKRVTRSDGSICDSSF